MSPPSRPGPAPAAIEARLCTGVTTVFGLWTAIVLLCNFLGGSLVELLVGFGVALVAGLPLLRRLVEADPAWPAPDGSTRQVLALALLGAILAWWGRRPDADDALYLSLAVTAADHPLAPLGTLDGMFGLASPSELLRPYRLHSLELVAAAGHLLSGVDARHFLHAALPPLAGGFVVLAQLRLGRELMGERGLAATCIALLFLSLVGDGWMSHGHVGLARLHQGKALLVLAFLPLCYVQLLELRRHPSWRNGLRLWLVVLASIGMSSSALVLVPIGLLLLRLGSSWRGGWRQAGTGWVLAAVAGCLALAAWAYAPRGGVHPAPPSGGMASAGEVVASGLGHPAVALATALLALLGIAGLRHRRALGLLLAAVALTAFNPLVADDLNQLLQRKGLLPRATWLLPLPLMVASGALWLARRSRRRPLERTIVAGAIVAGLFLALPGARPLRAALHRPPARIDNLPPQYWIAHSLARELPAGGVVLAPPAIAQWIPTLHDAPAVLYSRPLYETYLADVVGPAEAALRGRLANQVRHGNAPRVPCERLEELGVSAIVLTPPVPPWVRRCGFAPARQEGHWELWARDPG